MAKKLTWVESYTTYEYWEAEITDEQAALFEENEEEFFETVSFRDNANLISDKVKNDESFDFEVVEEE